MAGGTFVSAYGGMQFLKRFLGANETGEELFLFVHVPKTGGQTLRDCFIRQLVFHREFIHLGPTGEQKAAELGLLPFEERSPQERAQAKIILGHKVDCRTHCLVAAKIPRYITFLRDTAEVIVSLYNFRMVFKPPHQRLEEEPPPPFEAWYRDERYSNFMVRWILTAFLKEKAPAKISLSELRRANAALEQFWFVGCTEFLDRDGPLLLKRMGISPDLQRVNVGGVRYPKRLTLDDSLRDWLYKKSPADVELYGTWKERLPESLARLKEINESPT